MYQEKNFNHLKLMYGGRAIYPPHVPTKHLVVAKDTNI